MMARNLVDNAVRYTPAGGTVSVKAGVTDNRPWLQVSDNGPGIPNKERALIFHRFHRVTNLQTSGINGSGLGLAIVERIAKLHGASIEMSDGLDGKGIALKIWFPAHES
jgi:two-component system sensor histidine kinase QseC